MDMEVDERGTQEQEIEDTQTTEEQTLQMQVDANGTDVAGKRATTKAGGKPDYAKMIAERDAQIADLKAQIVEASKSAEATEKLESQIEELKRQAANDKLEYALNLAGCRNAKAAKALLDDYNGDVEALKLAEPWMFENEKPSTPKGKTGLTPAGASSEDNAIFKRWRKLAGLEDEE